MTASRTGIHFEFRKRSYTGRVVGYAKVSGNALGDNTKYQNKKQKVKNLYKVANLQERGRVRNTNMWLATRGVKPWTARHEQHRDNLSGTSCVSRCIYIYWVICDRVRVRWVQCGETEQWEEVKLESMNRVREKHNKTGNESSVQTGMNSPQTTRRSHGIQGGARTRRFRSNFHLFRMAENIQFKNIV